MKNHMLLIAAAVSAVLFASLPAHAATDAPPGFTKCTKEQGTCSFRGRRRVAFGAAGRFVFRDFTGSVRCRSSSFGSDPIPGKRKYCSFKKVAARTRPAAAPAPAPAAAPAAPAAPQASVLPPAPPAAAPAAPANGRITGATCVSTGSVSVSETIRVTSGTFDGGCKTFNATSALGDGSQDEGQDPVFRVENGSTLKNVIIGNNGADGIHVRGGGTLDNILWTNVGEDALTIKESGTVNVRNISGFNGEDKFFQINAASTLNVSNAIINGAGKAVRQNGGTNFRTVVTFDRVDLSNLKEGVFRTDSSSSTARITNSRLRSAGTLCIGYASGSCTSSGVTGN